MDEPTGFVHAVEVRFVWRALNQFFNTRPYTDRDQAPDASRSSSDHSALPKRGDDAALHKIQLANVIRHRSDFPDAH